MSEADASRQPAAAEAEQTLLVRVERCFFVSDDRRFAVIACVDEDGHQLRAKGPVAGLHEGDDAELIGRFVDEPRYGRTFRVRAGRPRLPSTREGVARLIAGLGIPGIGKRRAAAAAQALGSDPLQTLRETPELLLHVPGLGRARAETLLEALGTRLRSVHDEAALHELGLGAAAIARLTSRYPEGPMLQLRADPYRAIESVPGLGFRTADSVARALGLAAEAPTRLRAGLRAAADELARRGHTAPEADRLLERASALLDVPYEQVERAAATTGHGIVALRLHGGATGKAEGGLVPGGDANGFERLGQERLVRAELRLAERTLALLARPARTLSESSVAARLEQAVAALGHPLAQPQRDAIATSLSASLHVVTGGPGTGKTTIVRGLLAALSEDAPRLLLAAPTGRAARRLAEATGQAAQTLHRLLEFDPHRGGFSRDADNPLEADVLIVDEASMIDVPLADAVFAALPAGARLILIGDADQLPSVGPGAVLDDLIRSGLVPTTRLTRVYRQGARSGIVDAAHAILDGVVPSGARDETGDFFVILRSDAEAVAATIEEVVADRLPARFGFDPTQDVAVLVPMHRGAVGTRELNQRLGGRLNPGGRALGEGLRAGDKVLQSRNNYDLEVFNGDIGHVIGRTTEGLIVRFGERDVVIPDESREDLDLAFAMTVHKSQGSEMPAVVIGLEDAHHVLLERNLLYTAVTRARHLAVIVATPRALQRAVRNTAPRWRATLLADALLGRVAVRRTQESWA